MTQTSTAKSALVNRDFSTDTGDFTHPVKEDVKKKYFSLPSRNAVWLASSPSLLLLLLRGVLVLPLWIAA